MIKAILFDLDLTLLDRDTLYRNFAASLLRDMLPDGLPEEEREQELEGLIQRDAKGYGYKPDVYRPLIEKYHLPITVDDVIDRWASFTLTQAVPYPETEAVLGQLAARYALGVITNGESNIQANKIKSAGIIGWFDAVTISGDLGIEKPDPRIFTKTLEQMGVSSEEAVYVGDQWVNDVTGALASGLKAVWLHAESDRDPLPDGVYRIPALKDLPGVLHTIDVENRENWPERLVRWYLQNQRDLPWRGQADPYAVWISEIMLQQTRVEAVIGYYERFMEQFPTVQALAAAPEDQVLKAWEGLGYYSRARNLQKAARVICEELNGRFPAEKEQLLRLPGIGPYTAGAVASIAFGKREPAVDGNVLRVLSRLYAIRSDIMSPRVRTQITELDAAHIPAHHSAEYTQSLMDLGAAICIPGNPRCEDCPLQQACRAYRMGVQTELPYRRPKHPPKEVQREVYLLFCSGRVLVTRRPEEGVLGGLWEFPGTDRGESFADRYGIEVHPDSPCMHASHTFTHIHWEMEVYEEMLLEPLVPKGTAYRWMDPAELEEAMLPSAFRSIRGFVFRRLKP